MTRQLMYTGYSSAYRALVHPLGREILAHLLVRREGSPKELAEILDANFKQVCERIQFLGRGGLIELMGTDTHRGGMIHVYGPTDLASRFAGLLAEEVRGEES
jgi:predicted transcriptional regulator